MYYQEKMYLLTKFKKYHKFKYIILVFMSGVGPFRVLIISII